MSKSQKNFPNVKDFIINKSTLFQMTSHNSFKIRFKKNILKEEFFDFLKKNIKIFITYKHDPGILIDTPSHDDEKNEFIITLFEEGGLRYYWAKNYKHAEEITNFVNKKFSSLDNLTNDEIWEFKRLLSEKLNENEKITSLNKFWFWILGIGIAFMLLIWSIGGPFTPRTYDIRDCEMLSGGEHLKDSKDWRERSDYKRRLMDCQDKFLRMK